MKDQLRQYLESLGMTGPLVARVESVLSLCQSLCPEEITGICVSEYYKEDQTREYESVWFFSESYGMEAGRFISQDSLDLVPMRKRVVHWVLTKQDYDFETATDKSRLRVQFALGHQLSGSLKASKENCDHLRDIFKRYVVPNVSE